MSGETSI
jgi:hypothetical protein